MLKLFKTTKRWSNWWKNRKIDWQQAYGTTVDHPHRDMLVDVLSKFDFRSVLEVGCASGPNLVRILRHWPDTVVGGVDVNPQAIAEARRLIPRGVFEVREADDLYFSNDCSDMALSDACLIYYGRKRVRKAIKEMTRCAKGFICLVEFHSESWLDRLMLKLTSGYNAHDWKKLLTEMGFDDIIIRKIPSRIWSGLPWERYGHIITARCPPKV